MTGRERLNAILKKQPKDRLSWTTIVDRNSLQYFPETLQGNDGIDFYRHLGCDIFMLNGMGTPHEFRSPAHQWASTVNVQYKKEGQNHFTLWQTKQGCLTLIEARNHPIKYPVDSIEAVRIYRNMWEEARFDFCDDSKTFASLNGLIGEDGVVTRFWGPSAIPLLLERMMGVENFYYLMADHPDEMDGLIRTMHERELQAFEQLALGPWDFVTLCENTSTYYISPKIYEQYNMPHQRDFVQIIKDHKKTAILHMCGHIRNILYLIKETRCDGIHFLTPPPTGDTPWETALDIIAPDLIIFGTLDPSIFVSGPLDDIEPALDRLITPRLRASNFILSPTSDGIVVDIKRFLAVKHWMEEHAGCFQ